MSKSEIVRIVDNKQIIERPKGSGNLFDHKDRPCGRWVDGGWNKDLPHVEQSPKKKDQGA